MSHLQTLVSVLAIVLTIANIVSYNGLLLLACLNMLMSLFFPFMAGSLVSLNGCMNNRPHSLVCGALTMGHISTTDHDSNDVPI